MPRPNLPARRLHRYIDEDGQDFTLIERMIDTTRHVARIGPLECVAQTVHAGYAKRALHRSWGGCWEKGVGKLG